MKKKSLELVKKFIFSGVLVLFVLISSMPALAAENNIKLGAKNTKDTDPYSLINEVNSYRLSNGLPAYSANPILMSVAQQHAQYMAAAGVTHFGSNGSRPYERGLAAGYPLAGNLSLGGYYSENITAGANQSVQEAVSSWKGDAPHLNTMLSPNLTEIGAGVAIVGDYVYFVIDCARPTSSNQPQAIVTTVPGEIPVPSIQSTQSGPIVVNTLIPVTPDVAGKFYHTVKSGETLWLIAISYDTKIVELRKLNNLTTVQNIFPGEKLLVKIVPTATRILSTATLTHVPTKTSTSTLASSMTPTTRVTPQLVIPTKQNSSRVVFVVIILAALFFAFIFVRMGLHT